MMFELIGSRGGNNVLADCSGGLEVEIQLAFYANLANQTQTPNRFSEIHDGQAFLIERYATGGDWVAFAEDPARPPLC